MISLVGKQWVEIKTLALGRVVQAADGTVRTTDLSYCSRRAAHTAFRLDFPHAVEYLTRASHEAHALKHAGPDPVLAAVRALPPGEQRDTALGYLEPRLAQRQ